MKQTEKMTPSEQADFDISAEAAIDGLQDASVDLARYMTSHDLEEFEQKNITDAVRGLTVQIMALNGAMKDDDMDTETKKQLLENAEKSIAQCEKFMQAST